MSRRVLYDTEEIARNMRETFTQKAVRERVEFPWVWPRMMRHVGDNEGIAYASDKWKKDGDFELYKHVAESKNSVLIIDGLLRDFDEPDKPWNAVGPYVDFTDVPMPRHFALLAFLEEVNLRLFTRGTDVAPEFGTGNDGYVKVQVKHGMVGGSKIRWSEVESGAKDQTIVFVYTEADGPLLMVQGGELEVEKDGLVG